MIGVMNAHPTRPTHIEEAGGRTTSRDPAALTAWFDDALPRVFGYFLPRVGGRIPVAEDLTQETMLAAVQAFGKQADVEAERAWLFGIARHKLLDHYRRQGREWERLEPIDGAIDNLAADTTRLPRLNLDAIHIRDAIIATLDLLPARQRGALVLRYLDGLSMPETAALLDVSVHAAESLLARARRAFRTHYRTASEDES